MIEDEELIEENKDSLVTESAIKKEASLDSLEASLRARKVTGRVELDYNEGGRRRAVLIEITPAKGGQRIKMRRILGME
jgi:hypothetical protein